jgi:hypothetical protein
MRRSISTTTACVCAALGLVLSGCSSSDSKAAADKSDPATKPAPATEKYSFLFALTSDGGGFEPGTGSEYTLTLTGVDPHTIVFADRPRRDAAVLDTGTFVNAWEGSFADAAPNAVLVEHEPGVDSLVLVLKDPVYDAAAATLRYTATVTSDERVPDRVKALVDTTADSVPETFADASLFIDSTDVNPQITDAVTSVNDQITDSVTG